MTQYTPDPGKAYIHVDGGLYQVMSIGTSTVDQSEIVVYKHLYPFEQKVWLRPLAEWTQERFSEISDEAVDLILKTEDRNSLQQAIVARKLARRNKQSQ